MLSRRFPVVCYASPVSYTRLRFPFTTQLHTVVQMGPLVDTQAADRVVRAIAAGVAHGARIATGGSRWGPREGAWVQPTILVDVTDDNPCAKDELFGPVMVIHRYTAFEEALARANGTPYGLAAVVLTRDTGTALRAAQALEAGTVWVGAHGVFDPSLPYGGLKASGIGREYGEEGLAAYEVTKTVVLCLR